ncbi:DUF1810 domain-containing protein [soil metagenome]
MSVNNLQRFLTAHEGTYETALAEIKNGRKTGHWMWFIFPQIKGLGFSETSMFYAIKNLEEAAAYLQHPVLGSRLIEICNELLNLETDDAGKIFGSPDNLKLRSSLTLFSEIQNTDPVFNLVLNKFFNGVKDPKTLELLAAEKD